MSEQELPLRILLVDFNSYFASCEQQARPELRGIPVAVAPVLAETSCCIAANYMAKKAGVKTGTRVDEARRLCPGIQIVEARPSLYIQYHRKLVAAIEKCLPVAQILSIDELSCELTATFAPKELAIQRAKLIKETIAREVGECLTCSIGIAPNTFLAKLCSDMQKPNGLVVLEHHEIPDKILGCEVGDFLGIGDAMESRLKIHGITTVERLYRQSRQQLRAIWGGVEGERMYEKLRGVEIIIPPSDTKSISHSHVLPPDMRNEASALAVLHRLLQKAAIRLRDMDFFARGIQVIIEYRAGNWAGEIRFGESQDTLKFSQLLTHIWNKRQGKEQTPFKVGVVLTDLLSRKNYTPDLFAEEVDGKEKLHKATDLLNRAFGQNTVFFGGALGAMDKAPMRIAFTRIPEPELEEIDPSLNRRISSKPSHIKNDGTGTPEE